MTHGSLTAKVINKLSEEFSTDLRFIRDHRQPDRNMAEVGKVRSRYHSPSGVKAMLADLDAAVFLGDQLIALVEVEEKFSKPKILLGDVMATLLGSCIRIQGKDLDNFEAVALIVFHKFL